MIQLDILMYQCNEYMAIMRGRPHNRGSVVALITIESELCIDT